MHNRPFRFLESPAALASLRESLAQVGLSQQTTSGDEFVQADPYHPACLQFACPWLPGTVELQWQYNWWPDGIHSELARVSIVFEGAVRGEVNVQELLGKRLARPLPEQVVQAITARCAELTGKSRHPSRGGPEATGTA